MDIELLKEMHQKIDKYEKEGLFFGKYIVVFGSNEPAERIVDYLDIKNIQVAALADNNKKKDGTKLKGIPISLPDKLLYPKRADAVILIASRYYPEMLVQLEDMGYKEGREVFKVAEYSPYSNKDVTEQEFNKRAAIVKKGEQVYQRICREYPEIKKVFICPLGELGATYVGISFIKQYMEKNFLPADSKNTSINPAFVIVMVNKPCSHIAYMFGYENQVFMVKKDEMQELMQYAVFTDMDNGKILVLNHRFPYTCRAGEIGNYKGIHFVDQYRYSVFELDEGCMPGMPLVHRGNKDSQDYVQELFKKNNLPEGNTVILLPYANTAPVIAVKFWEALTKGLKEKGFTVCTNSSGIHEPVISGSQKIFFDLRYGLEVVEKAGSIIGLRSGLCDVLSTAEAKKIILYPDRIYGPDSFMNFYSLSRTGLSNDTIEILIDENDNKFVETVLNVL